MDAIVLAGIAVEVAERMPDTDYDIPRAEWRWNVVEKAIKIVNDYGITDQTDDVDEIVGRAMGEMK